MKDDTAFDVLVIGSGAAGLNLTLELANRGLSIAVLSKGELKEGSTYYAQGGIAAVLDETDSVTSHIQDTLQAGADLCDADVVRFVVENGRDAIRKLVDYGVDFSREKTNDGEDSLHLTREGGHSHRRVVHAADATGKAVETTLESRARAQDNVHILEHMLALDIIREKTGEGFGRTIGAYVFNIAEGRVHTVSARIVILATGGASRVYLYTSAPDGCTGDGIAMAWRAGCRIANMEFSQFHPTCLYHPEAKNLLITEAVRGEGGLLKRPDGTPFMQEYDERGELAPRDIVARAIDNEMKRYGFEHVLLDISHKPADFILGHFPTAYRRCLSFGFDITREAIPVVPAAHYTCGGVMTDINGKTDVAGLYAIGEVAYSGLHGANRMASNSLLECLVFSKAAADSIVESIADIPPPPPIAPWDESFVSDSDEDVVVSHNWDEVRRFMWDYVGIVRTDKRLARARHRCDLLKAEIHEYYGNYRVTADLLELRNLVEVASLIVSSAQARHESRGLHYTLDYPQTDASRPPQPTVLTPERK